MKAPSSEAVAEAAEVLRGGGLVLMPTETVYGLAVDATNPAAVAAVYEAKGRPSFNPLIVHVADIEAARMIAAFDAQALALAEAFWPGPLTIVALALADCRVCDLARAGMDTVAVRAPAHPAALALLKAFAGPICAPSANRSGRPSPTTLAAAMEETGFAAQAALDGGPCAVGLESTVVSVMEGRVRLLRPGGLARGSIEALVGPLCEAEDDARPCRRGGVGARLGVGEQLPDGGDVGLPIEPEPELLLGQAQLPDLRRVELGAGLEVLGRDAELPGKHPQRLDRR